jgi:hypothetical protein
MIVRPYAPPLTVAEYVYSFGHLGVPLREATVLAVNSEI